MTHAALEPIIVRRLLDGLTVSARWSTTRNDVSCKNTQNNNNAMLHFLTHWVIKVYTTPKHSSIAAQPWTMRRLPRLLTISSILLGYALISLFTNGSPSLIACVSLTRYLHMPRSSPINTYRPQPRPTLRQTHLLCKTSYVIY